MSDKAEYFTVRLSETVHREIVVPARSLQEALDSALLLKETANWASFRTLDVDADLQWSAAKTPDAEIFRPMNLMANLYLLYDRITRTGTDRSALAPLRDTVEMQVRELNASGYAPALVETRQRYEAQRAANSLPRQIVEARQVPTQPANVELKIVHQEPANISSFYNRLKQLTPRPETASTTRDQDNEPRTTEMSDQER